MRKRRKTRLEARLGLGEFEVELHDMLLQLMLLLGERVNCIAHARNLRPELTLAFCIRGACPLVGGKLVKRAANLIKLHTQRMLEIVGRLAKRCLDACGERIAASLHVSRNRSRLDGAFIATDTCLVKLTGKLLNLRIAWRLGAALRELRMLD